MKFAVPFLVAGALLGTYGPCADAHYISRFDDGGDGHFHNDVRDFNATLQKRAPSPIGDAEWEALGQEGCRLLKAMSSTDKDAAPYVGEAGTVESSWKDFAALEAWGWRTRPSHDWNDGERPRVDEPLNEYGISSLTEGNKDFIFSGWEHAVDTEHDQVPYKKTLGQYQNIFNIKDGVIIRSYNWGPRFKASRFNPPITPLPALRNWAEVIYLDWMHTAPSLNPPATGKKLQLIIAHAVRSHKTVELIDRALREVGRDPVDSMLADKECPRYRWKNRVDFPLGAGEPGNPLLASPNGLGQSLLLIMNKGAFGAKSTIDRITFWCRGSDLNLLFHVTQSD